MGNNLTVYFTSLSLEKGIDRFGTANCNYDYVNISQVNRYSQLFLDQVDLIGSPHYPATLNNSKVLCGNFTDNPPKPLQFATNEIVIAFRTDQTVSLGGGFRLEWAAVGCGGHFIFQSNNVRKNIISSPNYPSRYPYNVECIWYVPETIFAIVSIIYLIFSSGTSRHQKVTA